MTANGKVKRVFVYMHFNFALNNKIEARVKNAFFQTLKKCTDNHPTKNRQVFILKFEIQLIPKILFLSIAYGVFEGMNKIG